MVKTRSLRIPFYAQGISTVITAGFPTVDSMIDSASLATGALNAATLPAPAAIWLNELVWRIYRRYGIPALCKRQPFIWTSSNPPWAWRERQAGYPVDAAMRFQPRVAVFASFL